ncbi:MAG TPA: glycosyltransferase [Puia sp.]|nr:glycosyltransferase [Puia sp.]
MVRVNCICDGISFPFGEATNQRIIMIGKAVQFKGNSFKVYVNCKRPRNPLNMEKKGIYENIEFEHLNKFLQIGLPKWKNALGYYLIGFYNAFTLLKTLSQNKDNVIYLYSQGSLFNGYISLLSFLFKIPVIQEVNEWPENLDGYNFESFIYKSIMFRWAKGAISISHNITAKINEHSPDPAKIRILAVPILADKKEWVSKNDAIQKTFIWCGQVDGYLKDINLILKAFSRFCSGSPGYQLLICGKYKSSTGELINHSIAELGLKSDQVKLTGYISNELLFEYFQTATALISPLWNDQRSSARFPTKIASYLFASRPVLTCKMGETGKYLTDKENALFFEPGDYRHLSELMNFCIHNESIAEQIGKQGRILAETEFDFRGHADQLNLLFESVKFSPVKYLHQDENAFY